MVEKTTGAQAREDGVERLVEFRIEDALKTDLSPATVVTLYMLPWFNELMRPNFQKQLKAGSRIVAHDFGIEGWPAPRVEPLPDVIRTEGGYTHRHVIFLWRVE